MQFYFSCLLANLANRDEPAPAAGLYLKLSLPKELKEELFARGTSGVSRYERIWRGEIVTLLRSWLARKEVAEGSSSRYLTAGWQRTARATRPQAGARMNLGYADASYAQWVETGTLRLVVDGEWLLFIFAFPERVLGRTPCLPTIHRDRNGRPVFAISFSAPYQQSPISTRYILGVDVGRHRFATVSVWDEKLQKPVYQTTLSRRCHELERSIHASEKQVLFLKRKAERRLKRGHYIGYREALQKRLSIVGLSRGSALNSRA